MCVQLKRKRVLINDNPTGPPSHRFTPRGDLWLCVSECVCGCVYVCVSTLRPSIHLGQRAVEQTTFCWLPGWCPHCSDSHGRYGDEGSELYPWQCCYPAAPAAALIKLDILSWWAPFLSPPYPLVFYSSVFIMIYFYFKKDSLGLSLSFCPSFSNKTAFLSLDLYSSIISELGQRGRLEVCVLKAVILIFYIKGESCIRFVKNGYILIRFFILFSASYLLNVCALVSMCIYRCAWGKCVSG